MNQVTNQEVKSDVEDDVVRKKDFARQQLAFLKDNGIKDPLRLSRIFKACGPGQVQEAWKLSHSETDRARIDLLDVILTGSRGSQWFDVDRMVQVMKLCGLYVPSAYNAACFFRVLDGALEILVPDSYEFTEQEEREINEGLQRRKAFAATKNTNQNPAVYKSNVAIPQSFEDEEEHGRFLLESKDDRVDNENDCGDGDDEE